VSYLFDAVTAGELVNGLDLLKRDTRISKGRMWKRADIAAIIAVNVDEDLPGSGAHLSSFLEGKLSRS
jgi:hypothetical protein